MNAKHLTIALIAGCGLIPLVWAKGDEGGTAAKRKQPAAALPGEKMIERQWTVPRAFFRRYGTREEKTDLLLALKSKGAVFPAGSTASYYPKKQKLIVKNTADNLEKIDDAVKAYMDRYRPVGRTAEDFKKWAKEEYKRRQAAVKLIKKVDDDKSGQRVLDKLMKIYNAKKSGDSEISYNFSSLEYFGSLNVIDQKTRAAVEEKFAKQLKEIDEQQRRLEELEDLSDDVRWNLVEMYTGSVHHFAKDNRTHERWEITEKGIVKAKEEEDSSEDSETSSELPDNKGKRRK